MKGLFIKDFMLLSKLFQLMFIYIIIFEIVFINLGVSSFVSMVVVFFTIMTINCFAYDEQVNWDQYACCLPVSKLKIVLVRYLISLTMAASGIVAVAIVTNLTRLIMNKPLDALDTQLIGFGVALVAATLICSILFPFVYKFGVNKSRLILLIICFVPVGAVVFLSQFISFDFTEQRINQMLIASPFVVAALLVGSVALSLKILKRKVL